MTAPGHTMRAEPPTAAEVRDDGHVIYGADEARAVREGAATRGRWEPGATSVYAIGGCARHIGDGAQMDKPCTCRIVSRDMLDGDRELASAAPDLAASVEYHAPRADRAEAMLAGCACRTERPTVAEVRAATLGHGGGVIELLCKVPLKSTPRGDYRLVVAWVGVRCGVVVGLNTKSVNALRDATGYLFLTPDGPLSWARVAELVAEMEGGR